ncbi:unnamed protein product, partial [Phaeothamnion confervicola]
MAETEELLRHKILGSIGGGPYELLRAFRRMHRGRGIAVTVDDFHQAVRDFGFSMTPDEVERFFHAFDYDANGSIDFHEVC